MFDKHDIRRNACQLFGKQAEKGYDWWWHSFTAVCRESGKERSFFIEYFLCNPSHGGAEPIFGEGGKRIPSYCMVKAGTWGEDGVQLHRFFPWEETAVDYGVPYRVQAGDCLASETKLQGSVCVSEEDANAHSEWMSDSGSISWDLEAEKQISFNVGYGASGPMRKAQLFEMFWHAEGMKTAYRGQVIFNGDVYDVTPETCFGYADKNWGKDFTTPWVWLSSNDLKSELTGKVLENSVFDIGGGRPKVWKIALERKLLSAVYYEGKRMEFNFSKFWTGTRTKFHVHESEDEVVWYVEQKTFRNRFVAEITCKKKEMLLVRYESPDGLCRHKRLWNGGNGVGTISLYRGKTLIDRIRAEHIGCEYGEYDTTSPYR